MKATSKRSIELYQTLSRKQQAALCVELAINQDADEIERLLRGFIVLSIESYEKISPFERNALGADAPAKAGFGKGLFVDLHPRGSEKAIKLEPA